MTDRALAWMSRDDWRGGCSGPVAEACDFAREIAQEWGERMLVRFDGARTNHPDGRPNDPAGRLLWTVFATPTTRRETEPETDQPKEGDHA